MFNGMKKEIKNLLLNGTEHVRRKCSEWVEKTVDAMFIHSQVPKIGSVVYCNLVGAFEHTGIYVGHGEIVHLNGNGMIEKVNYKQFVGRLEGFNPAFSIFCATDSYGKVISDKSIAERALEMVGSKKSYNLIYDNCHCFTAYCLNGSNLVMGYFSIIEMLLKQEFSFARWRAINI